MKLVSTLREILKNQAASPVIINRDKWTLDILRLLVFLTILPSIFVLLGVVFGRISFIEAYLIFVDLLLLILGWQAAKRGGWRWAGLIPPLISFLLGINGLSQGLGYNTTILMFSTAVVLAGMLQGSRASILYVFFSTIAYALITYLDINEISSSLVSATIIVLICLLALALSQWYFFSRLQEHIEAQHAANQELEDEISRRKHSENIQLLQESQIKRLTDNMTDMVAEIDMSGKYLYTSPSYFPVLGYQPDELTGLNSFELVHPDDIAQVKEAIQRAISTNQPERGPYRVKHADGHYVWVESSGKFMTNGPEGSKTMIISSHDISQQRQAEENNLDSEKKFRSLIESSPLGIHMYAIEEDSRLVFNGYNPSANSILHIDHSQYMGKTIEEAFPDLISTDIPDTYRRVALIGESRDVEQIVYEDGKIHGVFEVHAFQTSPGKMASFFSDITDRTRAADALKLSEAKFSTAFLTSPDSININRLSDGLYIDINQGFSRMSGYSREDVIGKTSLELNIWVNPADRDRLVEGVNRDGLIENLDAQFQTKDGRIIQGLMSARIIMVEGQKCLLNITRDITERKLAEIRLHDAHFELEHAYEATLLGWARALDLREHETADHSRRVVEFSVRMATALGIDGQDLVDVQRGALLHDLGKVGVPDNILLKPGPLTSDEWVIMRQHPLNAYNLLKDIEYLRGALDIPYCHHEHWDGSGYPRGLKGEEIPLTARIFAIVDVWDALLSNRPYRPAWDKHAVLKYLQEQSGKLFDPAIVSLFIRLASQEDSRD